MDFSFRKRLLRPEFANNVILCLEKYEEMHTRKNRNFIEPGLLPIKSVDYRSIISPIALNDSHLLPHEYGMNVLLKIILNEMQDHNPSLH